MKKLFKDFGIQISDYQVDQFKKYYELLIDWNTKMNLTAITDYNEVLVKHFIDSVSLLKFISVDVLIGKSMIDVGTGAGFPGIPLAILCPNTKFVLLDSLNKRISFLNTVIKECQLENVETIHGRAEDYGQNENYREQFDFVTSRAVAELSVLSEYCIPFLKVGGLFVPYKSIKSDDELEKSKSAAEVLFYTLKKTEKFLLPVSNEERCILFIEKENKTPNKYPRKAGKPTKKPL